MHLYFCSVIKATSGAVIWLDGCKGLPPLKDQECLINLPKLQGKDNIFMSEPQAC